MNLSRSPTGRPVRGLTNRLTMLKDPESLSGVRESSSGLTTQWPRRSPPMRPTWQITVDDKKERNADAIRGSRTILPNMIGKNGFSWSPASVPSPSSRHWPLHESIRQTRSPRSKSKSRHQSHRRIRAPENETHGRTPKMRAHARRRTSELLSPARESWALGFPSQRGPCASPSSPRDWSFSLSSRVGGTQGLSQEHVDELTQSDAEVSQSWTN